MATTVAITVPSCTNVPPVLHSKVKVTVKVAPGHSFLA